ncbi:MAG TPA: apolipoprotein N-acyltransferase [Nitrospira sp.]|nr:apolipoprotein N-acyltransferase [Nitrospira sp.]
MSQWPVRLILLAATTGILLPYCFPKYDVGLLAWVALVPLHIALDGVSRRSHAFWLGWLAGIISSTGIMAWVVTAMHTYGKVPVVFSYGIMLLLTAYLGLYVALYSAGVVWFRMLVPRYGLFAAPCLWVAMELLRTYLLSGLPWSLLGYSQYRQLDLIQIADHLGVYGVSFLIVLTNVALAELYLWIMPLFRGFRPSRLPWELVTTAAMLVGLSWAYSTSLIATEAVERPNATLRVGVVQPNIDQAVKWDQAYREETLRRYDRLTESFGYGTDLVVWPEAATPFIFEREPVYHLELAGMANRAAAPLLFGSPAVRFDADRKPFLLNSAYLLSPDGQLLGRYDKQHLVPFGEYIPLKSSVLFFLEKMVEGIGDFQAGPGPTILSFQRKEADDPATARRLKFGVAICYEVIFPDLVRRMAIGGAEFLVTITNDAWFGDSSAPFQHFSMVVFRSVENHLAFARAANTGISGFIDPFGRIIEASPIFVQTALQADIPVRQTKTFYSRHGDVFAYGCMIISLLFCLYGFFGTKGAEPDAIAATPI